MKISLRRLMRLPRALLAMLAINKAYRLTSAGSYQEAYDLLQRRVPDPSKLVEVGFLMCRLQIRLGRWDESPQLLRKLENRIKSNPRYTKAERVHLLDYSQNLRRHGATMLDQKCSVDPDSNQDILIEEVDGPLHKRFQLK